MLLVPKAFAADSYIIWKTIDCESRGKANVWGDGHKSYGIAQFQLRTFNQLKNEADMPQLRWKNPDDQIILMTWAFDNGYARLWTCWRKHHRKWEKEEYNNLLRSSK